MVHQQKQMGWSEAPSSGLASSDHDKSNQMLFRNNITFYRSKQKEVLLRGGQSSQTFHFCAHVVLCATTGWGSSVPVGPFRISLNASDKFFCDIPRLKKIASCRISV